MVRACGRHCARVARDVCDASRAHTSPLLSVHTHRTPTAAPALSSVDKASFKAAYGGLASFIVECVKTDASADGLTAALAEYGVDGERAALVAKLFADNAPRLRDVHAAAGIALDRVVDVEWRLDYHVQSSGVGKVHKPLYFVKLKVAEAGGGLRDVDFTCTLQQLQDMLARLKEASTAVSKALGVDSAASGAGGRSGGGGGRGRRGSLERLRGGPGAGEKK